MRAINYKKGRKMDERRWTKENIIRHLSPVTGHGSKGFTLLEIMIALAIVSTAIITILLTVNYHAGVAYEHTLETRMLLLAKEKIAELEINPENAKGVFPETDFSYETTVKNIEYTQTAESAVIVELKTIVRGNGKEIELSQLVIQK